MPAPPAPPPPRVPQPRGAGEGSILHNQSTSRETPAGPDTGL